MNEAFITSGMAEDRYLKAEMLVHRFRTQIRTYLEDISEEIIDDHGHLFDAESSLDYKFFGVDNSRTLTTSRVEFDLNIEPTEYGSRRLNIGLEWVEPEDQGVSHRDEDSLCYVLYKIQRGSAQRFETVERRTRDSEEWKVIHFGEDQWPYERKEAPGTVYIPVETGPEIRGGLQTLRRHFASVYVPVFDERITDR